MLQQRRLTGFDLEISVDAPRLHESIRIEADQCVDARAALIEPLNAIQVVAHQLQITDGSGIERRPQLRNGGARGIERAARTNRWRARPARAEQNRSPQQRQANQGSSHTNSNSAALCMRE